MQRKQEYYRQIFFQASILAFLTYGTYGVFHFGVINLSAYPVFRCFEGGWETFGCLDFLISAPIPLLFFLICYAVLLNQIQKNKKQRRLRKQ